MFDPGHAALDRDLQAASSILLKYLGKKRTAVRSPSAQDIMIENRRQLCEYMHIVGPVPAPVYKACGPLTASRGWQQMPKAGISSYWISSSDRDYQVMIDLFKKGHYTWALFVGHLVIEKLLKAVFMQKCRKNPPLIHDLLRLAEKGGIELDEKQKDILDTVTTFNIQARYDDYHLDFFNKCTKDFTEEWINSIKELRKWLKQNLHSQ